MANQFQKDEYVYLLKLAQGDQTLNDFARKAGLSPGNLSRIMRGQLARPSTLARIAAASNNVNHEELMIVAGYMNIRPKSMRQPSSDQEIDKLEEIPVIKEVHGTPRKLRKNRNNPTVTCSSTLFGEGTHILFEIQDDAFLPRYTTGDLAIIDMEKVFENGSIALISVNKSETLLRRLMRIGNRYQIYSDNPAYAPRVVNKNEVRIYGVLVGGVVKN